MDSAEAPSPPRPPPLRKEFRTLAESRLRLARASSWGTRLRGDLQMHINWSDGSGEIREMADAAVARGYEFIAITDHSKGLSIANGINEAKLKKQSVEIEAVNRELRASISKLTVLHSIEMNLNPLGEGDMDPAALRSLDRSRLFPFRAAAQRRPDRTLSRCPSQSAHSDPRPPARPDLQLSSRFARGLGNGLLRGDPPR